MRILLATYWPLPHVGGVWTYVKILGNRLEQLGHEVDILAQHPDLTKYYLIKSGQTIKKSSYAQQAESAVMSDYGVCPAMLTPWMFWRESEKYAFELACKQIRLDHYDVIHTQDIFSTFVLRKAKPAHLPLVATIHGCLATEWVENDEIRYRTSLEREYLALEEYFGAMSPDSLILPSLWLKARMSSYQISHPSTQIIPYGLNQQIFQNRFPASVKPTAEAKEPNTTIIACPARLVAIKGQTYLFAAMANLVQKRPDAVCWLIGDGVMKEDLENQIHKLGLHGHVKLLGKRSDVAELLSSVDIVALPSLQDNLPFSIIEAQSAGKPVVASRVGGIVEMIEDGKNGFLVEPRNADELYEKLLLLVEDEALRERLSIHAQAFARQAWNDEVMAERTMRVYYEAIGSKKGKSNRDFTGRLTDRFRQLYGTGKEIPAPAVTIVQGTVYAAAAHAGFPDAHVHLLDFSGFVLRSTETNGTGQFSFHDVQPGNYELICSADGSGSIALKISPSRAEPLTLEIMLPAKQ